MVKAIIDPPVGGEPRKCAAKGAANLLRAGCGCKTALQAQSELVGLSFAESDNTKFEVYLSYLLL